ncbi:hypothetical protein CJU90_5374 [Yarrowia sp. C11]|nr:hypothetical protein CJU90_5374 [Yarrowia sp. C11]KAG5363972.1 hypothetical protein CKK34_2753 [Yarrowia sp. E02]
MEISIAIPAGAKYRILRDPHCLPRVPRSIANEVAQEKQIQRRRRLSEDILNSRRDKIHFDRSLRIPEWKEYRSSAHDTPCQTPPRRGSDSAIEDYSPPSHDQIRQVLLGCTNQPQTSNMFFPCILQEREPSFQDKVRFRNQFWKQPAPGSRTRDFYTNRNGQKWQGHPGWHRLLRRQYAFWGLDRCWREERSQFLQDKRRELAFTKQQKHRRTTI